MSALLPHQRVLGLKVMNLLPPIEGDLSWIICPSPASVSVGPHTLNPVEIWWGLMHPQSLQPSWQGYDFQRAPFCWPVLTSEVDMRTKLGQLEIHQEVFGIFSKLLRDNCPFFQGFLS
jgi:hypothetical protein